MAQVMSGKSMRVLMISTEYPPMNGGVGRYTANLTKCLQKGDIEIIVVCNEKGNGDIGGISPFNERNSDILLGIVNEVKPDLVHVQYEHGLYGLSLDPIYPGKTRTNIDAFYNKCKLPIVTTFHSGYTYRQWMNLVVPLNKTGKDSKTRVYARMLGEFWKHLLNYNSFHLLNTRKLGPNRYGIVFSKYLSERIPGTQVIYHGSEPFVPYSVSKNIAKKLFSIPEDFKIALALGFETKTKGWDILNKIKVPNGWKIVLNSSKNHYNHEITKYHFENSNIIDLNRGFLNDFELSYLFRSSDVLLLPYKVCSASGVMFDGLAHGLPFISSNIGFFREFASRGLGMSVNRSADEFSSALRAIDKQYYSYKMNVDQFKQNLLWSNIAESHKALYAKMIQNKAADIFISG